MKNRSLSVVVILVITLGLFAAFGVTTDAIAADVAPAFTVAQPAPLDEVPVPIDRSAAIAVPLDQILTHQPTPLYVDVAQTTVASAGLAVLVLLAVLGLAAYWFVRSRSPRHVRDHAPTATSLVSRIASLLTAVVGRARSRSIGSRAHAPIQSILRFSST